MGLLTVQASKHGLVSILSALSLTIISGLILYYLFSEDPKDDNNQNPDHIDPMMRYNSDPSLWYRNFTKAAVISDNHLCNEIAEKLLRQGASAIDVIVSLTACIGLVHPMNSGLGGGLFLTYSNDQTNRHFTVNGREMASENADTFMYTNIDEDDLENTGSSTLGGISVAVPGVIKALYNAHNLAGNLPWESCFLDTIQLAREGYPMDEKMHQYRKYLIKYDVLNNTNLHGDWRSFFNDNGEMKQIGDIIVDENLANTMERIALDPESFYRKDSILMRDIVSDIKESGGIITENDLRFYTAPIDFDPKVVSLPNWNLDLILPPAPSSGNLLAYMLGILQLFKKENTSAGKVSPIAISTKYHRLVEVFKFGYGQRSHLGDPTDEEYSEEINTRLDNLLNPENWQRSFEKINDNQTQNDPEYYGYGDDKEYHGTSTFAVFTENEAVSVTSSVNTVWASKLKGKRTGLVFNNHMDDFAMPKSDDYNYFNVEPNAENFIKPFKRPQSSMAPAILKRGSKSVVALGGSGGTLITSAEVANAYHTFGFSESGQIGKIEEIVSAPRLHHQLKPMTLNYQEGFDQQILEELMEKGHKIIEYSYSSSSAPLIYRDDDGILHAKGDNRKPDCMPGGIGLL